MSEDHIKVVCRIRPANARESSSAGQTRTCISIPESSNTVVLNAKPENKAFTFDFAADASVSQDSMFQEVGLPITESCLQGYNGTILCYGQTGSGKTYTIFGNALDTISTSAELEREPLRGLVPRVLGHLWTTFEREKLNSDKYSFGCKCSFYEIYQERVFDLLDTSGSQSASGLAIREDAKEGVYVEGCTEEDVVSVRDAHAALVKGYQNRHVAETNMNRESSRSHAVFQLSLEISTERPEDGIVVKRKSRFSMVDLAGSERQKDTNATGERLKEASVINKSLSTLGHVINTLADVASNGGRKHIHYRDSKLTFLLRDSLGGNSKTTLVATVSPAELCLAETLSTLKFAQRAKSIRNSAVLNEESSGSILALQREIAQLKARLSEGTVGGGLPSAGAAPGAAPEADEELSVSLLGALKRCELAEEQKRRAESKAESLNQLLEQSKSSVMGVKYMLKMRESEISRLKKKSSDPSDPAGSTEDLLRAATAAVREEMQGEIMKLRLEVKEQKTVIQDLSAEVGDKKWTPENEVSFNHSLNTLWEANTKAIADLKKQSKDVAEGKFAEMFGFTADEVKGMREKLLVSEGRLQEALTRLPQLQHGVVLLQRMLDEANGRADSLQLDLDAEKGKTEALTSTQAMVEELRREIGDKDDLIKQLEGGLQKSDSELKEQLRRREGEFKDKMNLVMKDNSVLLKRCRELEAAVAEFKTTLDVAVKSREAQKLLVQNSRLQIQSMEEQHADQLKALRDESELQKEELAAKIAALMDAQRDDASRVAELEASLLQSNQELAQAKFEAENAVEDVDNLFSQTQALIDERQTLLQNIEDCDKEILQLKEKISKQSSESKLADDLSEKLREMETAHAREKAELLTCISLREEKLALLENSASSAETERRQLQQKADALAEAFSAEKQALQDALARARDEQEEATQRLVEEQTAAIKALSADMEQKREADIKTSRSDLEKELLAKSEARVEADRLREECAASNTRVRELEVQLALEQEKLQMSVSELANAQTNMLAQEKACAEHGALLAKSEEAEAVTLRLLEVQQQLSAVTAERDLSLSRRMEETTQLLDAQAKRKEAEAAKTAALQQLSDLQIEHAAMCGHQNNKQKIQQHMNLKKDLQDKAEVLSQLQNQLVHLTFERDAARADAAKLRKAMRTVEVTSAPGDSSIASIKKLKSVENGSATTDPENVPNHNEAKPTSITI